MIRSLLFSLILSTAGAQALPTDPDTERWRAAAMNPELAKSERIDAIKKLYKTTLTEGKIPPRTLCIWDLLGRSGPIYAAAVDQQARLLDMGITVNMKAYTNEGVLADDLKAGQCDAALFTGIRARLFNKFTGTIDAIGAIPSSKHMNMLMKVLVNPKNAPRMEEGQFVVMGFAPMGAAYIFVNDKQISTLTKAAGKRVAVMDYDLVQAEMILQLGANPVPTSVVSAGSKFNNRAVDVLPAPLVAYNIMELYRGIGDQGGIVNYPFSQLTLQLIGRKDKFPAEIAQLVREDFYRRIDDIEKQVERQTGNIPDNLWIDISAEDKADYQLMMQRARISLRDRGYYHQDMLNLQRKIRCKFAPSHPECTQAVE